MDMVAAIQAAKNQLEAQKKKRGSPTTASTVPAQHPAPPTNIISFEKPKKFNRKISDLDSPHPYHTLLQQQGRDIYIGEEEYDDDMTITSSLSGTPSMVHESQHLKRLHVAHSTSGNSRVDGKLLGDTSGGNPMSRNLLNNYSTYTTAGSKESNDLKILNSPLPEVTEESSLLDRMSRDAALSDTKEVFTCGKNGLDSSHANDKAQNNGSRSINDPTGNSTTLTIKNNVSDASTRIEEIMSAYQGKVDTILKRRDEGTTFKSLIESAVGKLDGGGTAATASSLTLAIGKQHHNTSSSTVATTTTNTPSTIGSLSEGILVAVQQQQQQQQQRLGIDDIMMTYKKKVGEIMSIKQEKQKTAMASISEVQDDDNHYYCPPSSSRSSYPRSIVDDEVSEERESGEDRGSASSGSGVNDSGRRSYSGSSSYSGNNNRSPGSKVDDGMSNKLTVFSAPAKTSAGPMSERAKAVLQSCNAAKPPQSSRSLSPIMNRTRIAEQMDNRSSSGDECSESRDSYISGASSASDALSAEIEGGAGFALNRQGRNIAKEEKHQEESLAERQSDRENTRPVKRMDSLTLAQEMTAGTSPKSSFLRHSFTKGSIQSEIDAERKRRLELERRLKEATQRGEDVTNENIRLNRAVDNLQGQLDKVQTDARSNKFSQSEQASRIMELERKLRNEEIRVEELEKEKDVMKEEYDADLEEQKDINRQLEQMVMSEEFEKELEDEINQVKELEHANRRFKVKIDMLEREKNTITKKFEVKVDDLSAKNKSMEEQLAEFESKSSSLESAHRQALMEIEAKLASETRRLRDHELSAESSESKYKSKLRSLEIEMAELREVSSKIDEYEQVLGKLMERNNELEMEAKLAREDTDMANRQVELSDRRRALKVKDLEAQLTEQKLIIEQQQETLDESVKTILKLYSLNNGKGDDMSTFSEDKLTDIARTMVPRMPAKSNLPTLTEEAHSISLTPATNYTRSRQSTGRRRTLADDTGRGGSHGLDDFGEFDDDKLALRPKSRGRGDRSESIRQLTARALSPGRDRPVTPGRDRHLALGRDDSQSPPNRRRSSVDRKYDPTGPDSLALVPVIPRDSDDHYSNYEAPTLDTANSRRGGSRGGSAYDRFDSNYTNGASYSNALVPRQEYESRSSSRHQRSRSQLNMSTKERDRDRNGQRRRDDDRNRVDRSRNRRDQNRFEELSPGGASRDRQRDDGQGWNQGPRRRDPRKNYSRSHKHEQDSFHRRPVRDPTYSDEFEGGRAFDHSRPRPRGKPHHRNPRSLDP